MRLLNAFATLMIVGGITPAMAECTAKSGDIDGEYWTRDGSPYCVEGDIRVLDLVIAPGVQIEFAGAYAFEIDPFATRFEALGEEDEPIFFVGAVGAESWRGIEFNEVRPWTPLVMEWCRIHDADQSGVEITDCFPVLRNCTISENSGDRGGGLTVTLDGPQGELVLEECFINNNSAMEHGGGIYAVVSSGSLKLRGCQINSNGANEAAANRDSHGGGIYIQDAGDSFTIEQCEINSNECRSNGSSRTATSRGGGIYLSQGSVHLIRSTLDANDARATAGGTGPPNAHAYGGAVYADRGSLLLTNSIITNNTASGWVDRGSLYLKGSGVYTAYTTVILNNSTIAFNNPEGLHDAAGIVGVQNSIVYFNEGSQLVGDPEVIYSCIQDGWGDPDSTNIDDDPLFVLPPLDFSLRPSSPCIDAGNPDPYFDDGCHPPGQGTERNDMGAGGGPNNCPPSNCNLQIEISEIPPIVHRGQEFDYTVCVSNPCESRLSFDEVIFAVAGQGISRELTLFESFAVSVNSGLTYCSDLRLGVPPATPTGSYTGTVKLYLEGELLDDHSVNVTVQ